MTKKTNKKGLADKVMKKRRLQQLEKSTGAFSNNPFNIKVNRVKNSVLGRKLEKCDKGNPAVSHSKAVQVGC